MRLRIKKEMLDALRDLVLQPLRPQYKARLQIFRFWNRLKLPDTACKLHALLEAARTVASLHKAPYLFGRRPNWNNNKFKLERPQKNGLGVGI